MRGLLCYHRGAIYGFRFNEIQGQGKVEVRNTQLVAGEKGHLSIEMYGSCEQSFSGNDALIS